MRTMLGIMAALGLVAGLVLGAVGFYALDRAPDGAGAFEAVRVALDPGAEYAVLHAEGMT